MTPRWIPQRDEMKALAPAIIDRAVAILDTPEKWIKGAMARNSVGESVKPSDSDAQCFCTVGALCAAARAVLAETDIETDAADLTTAATAAIDEVATRILLRRRDEFCDALRGTIAEYDAEPGRYEDSTEAALDLIGRILGSVTGIYWTTDRTKLSLIDGYRSAIMRYLDLLDGEDEEDEEDEEGTTLSDIRAAVVRLSVASAENVLDFIDLNDVEVSGCQIDVIRWNDAEGRTYEEVIELLKGSK